MLELKEMVLVLPNVSIKLHNSFHLFWYTFDIPDFCDPSQCRHWESIPTNSITPNDMDYLRFLWLEDAIAEIPKIVRSRFAWPLFGMTSSPYLLNSTLKKHPKTYDYGFKVINRVVNCFYIDDFFGGENLLKKAFELYKN